MQLNLYSAGLNVTPSLLTFLNYLVSFPVPSVIIFLPFWGCLSEVVLPSKDSAL